MKEREEILRLAQECLAMKKEVRPEVHWLGLVYERFRTSMGKLSKAEADQMLYERIRADSDTARENGALKIRYWRTGRHVPANRSQCLAFGEALGLTEEEQYVLIQSYFDRSDAAYAAVPGKEDTRYWKRRERMEKLRREYLMRQCPGLPVKDTSLPDGTQSQFRHLYYRDAYRYTIHEKRPHSVGRSESISYHSELNRTMQLTGEIPRKTMLRHLIILCAPALSVERMDECLSFFGYLPLSDRHTLTGGERLDWLIRRILFLYEGCCSSADPEAGIAWLQSCCRILDGFFAEQGESGLRFMDFKSLNR